MITNENAQIKALELAIVELKVSGVEDFLMYQRVSDENVALIMEKFNEIIESLECTKRMWEYSRDNKIMP